MNLIIPLELVTEYGASVAVTYALLHTQSVDNVCTVKIKTLSQMSGCSVRTVQNNLTTLENHGLITRKPNTGYTTTYELKKIITDTTDKEPDNLPEIVPAQELPELSKYAVPKQKRKRMPYYVMLDALGSPLASSLVTCEEDIKGISDDREIEKCTIPEKWAFTDEKLMVEDALKYLAYYSDMKDGEKKEFINETLLCLTEAICTGMKGKTHGIEPEIVIRRINELIHNMHYSFGNWLDDFARKYSDWADAYSGTIYNKHNYLKTCAINFLTEHKSGVTPGFMDYEELYNYGGV